MNFNNNYNELPFDPEEPVSCPYVNQHVMPAKRLPYHLKKYEYTNCPMNRRHVIKKDNLKNHLLTCPNRSVIKKLTEHIPDDVYKSQKSKQNQINCQDTNKNIYRNDNDEEEWGADTEENINTNLNIISNTSTHNKIHPSLINTSVSVVYEIDQTSQSNMIDFAIKLLNCEHIPFKTDYKSILNIHCQINKCSKPTYYEVTDHQYGFNNYSSKCITFNRNFYSFGNFKTIKDAHQDSSKWALLYAYIKKAPSHIVEKFNSLDKNVKSNTPNLKPAFNTNS